MRSGIERQPLCTGRSIRRLQRSFSGSIRFVGFVLVKLTGPLFQGNADQTFRGAFSAAHLRATNKLVVVSENSDISPFCICSTRSCEVNRA